MTSGVDSNEIYDVEHVFKNTECTTSYDAIIMRLSIVTIPTFERHIYVVYNGFIYYAYSRI